MGNREYLGEFEQRAIHNYSILPAGTEALAQSRLMLQRLWDGLGAERA